MHSNPATREPYGSPRDQTATRSSFAVPTTAEACRGRSFRGFTTPSLLHGAVAAVVGSVSIWYSIVSPRSSGGGSRSRARKAKGRLSSSVSRVSCPWKRHHRAHCRRWASGGNRSDHDLASGGRSVAVPRGGQRSARARGADRKSVV